MEHPEHVRFYLLSPSNHEDQKWKSTTPVLFVPSKTKHWICMTAFFVFYRSLNKITWIGISNKRTTIGKPEPWDKGSSRGGIINKTLSRLKSLQKLLLQKNNNEIQLNWKFQALKICYGKNAHTFAGTSKQNWTLFSYSLINTS